MTIYEIKNKLFLGFFQYSFLIQLITDANGILVLIKFITEKFNNLNFNENYIFIFENKLNEEICCLKKILENTIYKILKIMFITCKNSPDKIVNVLMEYNTHVLFIFLNNLFQ